MDHNTTAVTNTASTGSGGGPCGACKFLRRKCTRGCVFAPYFEPEGGAAHFAAVHKVFGASNASKLLLRVPPHRRLHAVLALCYEAHARLRDPVYGCVAHIFALQQQVVDLEAEVALIQAHLTAVNPPNLHHHNHSSAAAMAAPAHATTTTNTTILTSQALEPFQLSRAGNEAAVSCYNQQGHLHLLGEEDMGAFAQECLSEYLQGGKYHHHNHWQDDDW